MTGSVAGIRRRRTVRRAARKPAPAAGSRLLWADTSYDVIYVNGSNNVPNLRKDSDTWKVRLIEEEFRARMWEGV